MSTVPGSTPPSGGRRRRALLLTAALVALAVFAATAFVLFRHSGGNTSASSTANRTAASPSSKSTPLLPLPPQEVVAALGKLQTKMDSPHLATQAKSWVPQLRASFMRQHELLPAGLTFDPRSLRYVNLHRHAYVTNPTHTADIEANDAAGSHYVVRLHRTPGGHWLQVAQVSGTFATLHAAAVQKGTATQAVTTNAAGARLLAHEDLPSVSTCPEAGGKQVVILVHGFHDSRATWGSARDPGPIRHAVSGLPNVFVDAFDYSAESTSWVDNENIGPALAQLIDCFSRQKRTAHTVGKVILVDHSMGGLATRYAAAQTVDGRPVWDEIGLVVTLGTPNLGSGWANAADPVVSLVCNNIGLVAWAPGSPCRDYSALQGMSEHSGQIDQLPWFDANAPIPVRAIAGDVTLTEPSYKGRGGYTDDTSSDLIVSTRSALAASQDPATVPLGSGNTTIRCKQSVYQALSADCWHVGLLTDAKAQKAVVSAIKLYLTNEPFVAFAGTWRNPFSSITIGAYGSGEAHYDLPITDCPLTAHDGVHCHVDESIQLSEPDATGVATVTVVSSNTIVSAAEGQVLKDQATGALASYKLGPPGFEGAMMVDKSAFGGGKYAVCLVGSLDYTRSGCG